MSDLSDLQTLLSMGYSIQRAEEALIETNCAGIELAIEWLLITDVNTVNTKQKEKAPIESLNDQLFNCHLEEPVRESLKETATTCDKEVSNSVKMSVKSDKNTRILARLLDGKTLSKVFNTQEKLNAVVFWIQTHINTDQFSLMTTFPKKVFTAEDYKQSLDALNLVPSAVVIVTQLEKWENLKVYHGVKNDDESHKIEEKRRKEEIELQSKKKEEERLALERVRIQIEDDKAARRQRWPDLYPNAPQPAGNRLLQNQPQAILGRPNQNQNRTEDKKFE